MTFPPTSLRDSHGAFAGDEQPSWAATVRQQALSAASQLGLPTRRVERWKYTNTRELSRHAFAHDDVDRSGEVAARVAAEALPHAVATAVFVNGRFAPSLSTLGDTAGVTVRPAGANLDHPAFQASLQGAVDAAPDQVFATLNTAFFQDGVIVEVARDTELSGPIHVLYLTTEAHAPVVSHPRSLVLVGRHASAQLVEQSISVGAGVCLTNAVTQIRIDDGGRLSHHRGVQAGSAAHHIGVTDAKVGRDARYEVFSLTLGGALVRVDLDVDLAGTGAEVSMNGLYVTGGNEHVDHHTCIEHTAPHTTSSEQFKGIVGDRGTAVFNGRVVVRKPAQKTDSEQSNRNLLLSDDATVNSKPELEIYADDVKCAHGSTVGQLDPAQIWYLRSRGIGAVDARHILTRAFAEDVIATIADEALRQRASDQVNARLTELAEGHA